ncbi:MAG: cation-binding protein [Leptothrix sp. (in: Bacteria)]|nr:cation-binding protein [Leptothrix sp. (in: b-proteobacteria)]
MSTLMSHFSPTITNMIRLDHTHVLSTFHKYKADTPPDTKQALVNTVSLALEIHAQLEEEIFYPALRAVTTNEAVLAKSEPEHNEMRSLIGQLRDMKPTATHYDSTFMSLMRHVIHHVADEETVLLPEAEVLLADQLSELGAQMTRRRLALAAPKAGHIAANMVRAMPTSTMLVTAGGLVAGGYLLKRALERRT